MADPFSFAISTVAQIGISYLFPSEGPRLKDLKVSASTYGAAIPWVFGLTRVAGNMIWSTKIKETKKKSFGGKGGFVNNYTYSCTFAMGLCKGPITSVIRVWGDGKLIYDATAGSITPETNSSKGGITGNSSIVNKYPMHFMLGAEDQLPDPAVIADKGEANAPAFRGLAGILFDNIQLADFGNRIPQITAEVYVGPTTVTTVVTPLTEADGTTAIDTSYEPGEQAYDWRRTYGYLRYGDELEQFSTKTAKQVQGLTPTLADGSNLTKLLCVGADSSVYGVFGSGHSKLPIGKLDAYSLQVVASFGEAVDDTHADNAQDGFLVDRAATAMSNTSIEYLMSVGPNGQAGLLKTASMSYFAGEAVYVGGAPGTSGAYRICAADADTSGNPSFYVLWGAGSTIKLTHFSGISQTDVQTITGAALSVGAVLWDSSIAGALMFWSDGASHFLSKWSLDTGEEAWRRSVVGYPANFSSETRLLTGKFAWVFSGNLYIIETATGEPVVTSVNAQEHDPTPVTTGIYPLPTGYTGDSSNMQAFDDARGALFCFSGVEGALSVTAAGIAVSVGTIVGRMFAEGGMTPEQYDITPLYDIQVRGFGWASGTDIKSILDELKRLYLFDISERQGALVATMRGNIDNGVDESVDSILQNALGSSAADATDFWQETRIQEADLPSSVSLAYMNYQDDYETSVARSARISNPIPTMFSRQTLAMEINVVMTAIEAKTQVNRILYSQWAERVKYDTRLPWAYLALDPADVVNVTMNDGREYTLRLDSTEIGADNVISTMGYSQDSGAYTGWTNLIADGGGNGIKQVLAEPSVTLPFVFNTPLLRDQDDTGGSFSRYYIGMANGSPGAFNGGALYRSTNNLDYTILSSSNDDLEWGSIIGVVAPPATGDFALDWKTQIVIHPSVDWFELDSITDDQLWAGGNPCLVGNEVIQFRDAVENMDGTWTISNLLRARRGTEWAADQHVAGERFVFLSNTTVGLQGDVTNSRGQARYFKGVGQGVSLQSAPVNQITYEPRDLMPYAPVQIMREFTTGEDIDLVWSRRTRLGGNLMDGTGEVALAERFERYEVYFLDAPFAGDLSRGAPPATYRRMYTVSEPQVTYRGDEQGVDGFAPLVSTLHVVIYQLSDAVGRGFPAPRDIAPTDDF